jgi:cyclic beta-1,2-glucan synthetase
VRRLEIFNMKQTVPKFIGEAQNLKNPQVMDPEFPLSNTAGAVLDPIVSMRIRVFIPAGETVQVSYITGVADSKGFSYFSG